MSVKLLSIIVPTYNMEAYLDRCLSCVIVDSTEVMSQYEVIVVNDGSTDRSAEIAHGFERQYPETFRVIDKENGNYGSCINVALPVAQGKYVKVLDADDMFDKDAFMEFLLELKELDVDTILTEVNEVNLDNEILLKKDSPDIEANRVLPWQSLIPFARGFMFSHYFTYRRQMLLDIQYHQTEGYYYTDNEWVAYPLTAFQTVYYLPLSLYRYTRGRVGQSVSMAVQRMSLASYQSLIISLGKLWQSFEGDVQRKLMLYSCFSAQVKIVYSTFVFYRLYDDVEFRRFDQELITIFPEICDITNRILIGGRVLPMPIVSYWRERRPVLHLLAYIRYRINRRLHREKNGSN